MASEPGEFVVPLHEEAISVAKEKVETGRLKISTVTRQDEIPVDEMLTRETVEVERKAMNQPVDRMPSVREEGDTLIIPVVEEILVVERRLMLKEEIRVRMLHQTERHQERVKVRKQDVTITRLPIETEKTAAAPSAGKLK